MFQSRLVSTVSPPWYAAFSPTSRMSCSRTRNVKCGAYSEVVAACTLIGSSFAASASTFVM